MTTNKGTLKESNKRKLILSSEVSREKYILDCFIRDFPTYKDITYEEVKDFISRSEHVKLWFVKIMETFRITFEMPEIARDILPQEEFIKVKDSLNLYSDSLRDEGNEIQKLARNFSSEINRVRSHHESIRVNLRENKLLEILTLTSDKLPMSLQFKIVKYIPTKYSKHTDEEGIPLTKQQFQKKVFNDYIKELLEKYLKGEDTHSLIRENFLS